MAYLVNPSGITVEIDSETQANELVQLRGFRVANESEIESYRNKIQQSANLDLNQDSIFLFPPSSENDGYSSVSKYLFDALTKEGFQFSQNYDNQKIGFAFHHPHALRSMHTQIKILYTMIESTKIPDSWHEDLKLADKILVPSKFCQEVFKKAGFETEVVPLPVNNEVFYYREKQHYDVFSFLHYDAFNHRKGWDLVFDAFNKEFKKDEPVKLILKTVKETLPFPIVRSQYPNVEVIKKRYKNEELAELLQQTDCFVFPSRGEGFGLTPLEALATGTPVITLNASGMSEYFNSNVMYEVKVKEEIPALYDTFKGQDVGVMFEADIKDLQKQMRYVFENRAELFDKGVNGSIYVRDNYSVSNTVSRLKDILLQYKNSPIVIDSKTNNNDIKFSIVILTYNALEYTKKCLSSIKLNTSYPFELIVIDNNSSDGTQDFLKEQKEKGNITKLVLNKDNKGVAGGRNQGTKLSNSEIVIFLDNDTEVKRDWDKYILSEFNDENVGIVGKSGTDIERLHPIAWKPTKLIEGKAEVDVVAGFCFAFRKKLFSLIGEIGTDFPYPRFWHEDLEFCLRAKKAGFKVIWNSKIPIHHYEHKSMGDNPNDVLKNENQLGFFENAQYIMKKQLDENIIYYHRNWHGYDNWSSYDRIARGLIDALRDNGMIVLRDKTIDEPEKSFNLCKGIDFHYKGDRYASIFMENDRPPRNWKKAFKRFNYIISSSGHFINNVNKIEHIVDINKVIDVDIVGIESDIYNFDAQPLENFYNDKFKFLMVGASQPRKSTELLLKCYADTFTKKDNVVLIIKDSDYGQSSKTKEVINQLQKNPNCPEIVYLFEHWDSEYLARVYKTVSLNGAYIHPHRAEGFGMPIIEAIACGCRVGTTNFGGPAHNTKDLKTVTLFNYDLIDSTFHNWSGEPFYDKNESPKWAEPKIEDIKQFMKFVYKYDVYNKLESKKASKMIIARFSFDTIAKNLIKVIKSKS